MSFPQLQDGGRYRLIGCEIFYRELCALVARSRRTVDIEFLPKGLHDIGAEGMVGRLQAAVDRVDARRYRAVLLGYALCNHGIRGLTARELPVVVPRAHDCITLFLGSHERYLAYFDSHPGTYFLTTGWIERGDDAGELRQISIQHQAGMDLKYEELVARYGEDNARYLYEQLCDTLRNYRRVAYIRMGVCPEEAFEAVARRMAGERGWELDFLAGDLGMLRRLIDGPWDEKEFLVLQPGQRIASDFSGGLIRADAAGG